MDCLFCTDKDVKNRTIIDDDLVMAFPAKFPIVPGHILICPKRHVRYCEELTQDEHKAIESLREKIKKALGASLKAEGFNYAWNEEEIGGQSVPHFHLHIVPRTKGDTGVYGYEPREFLYRPKPRTVSTPNEELMDIVNLVRNHLTNHDDFKNI